MKKWRSRILHMLLFVFAMALFVYAYSNTITSRNAGYNRQLIDGWNIQINDDLYQSVDLTDFKFPVTHKGDWVSLWGQLPDDLPDNVVMRINMVHCATRVVLNDEILYDYGWEDYEDGKMLGFGTRFISIPDGSAGGRLRIIMFVTENNAFSTLSYPEIYEESTGYMVYYGKYMIPFVVSITLIVAGLCISLVTFVLYFRSYYMERLFSIGIFALCIGCWTLCNYNLDYIFTDSLTVKTYIEYSALYLLPFPILMYFRQEVEKRDKAWECFFLYALIIIEVQLLVVAGASQLFRWAHLSDFVPVYLIFLVVSVVFVVHLAVADLRHGNTHKVLMIGFAAMIAVAFRDLVVFLADRYRVNNLRSSEYRSYVSVGALIFVVALLVDFIMEMRRMLYKSAETKFLEKIAYEDVLTGLSTRRKCEETFEEIDKRNLEYIIYQFDLNNLKNTNDDFGHEAGDDLIIRFANILRETFNEGETIGRMGGDEFIVIVTDAYGYNPQEKLDTMNRLMDEDNVDKEVQVSASAGYCHSSELNNAKALDVYKEADKRMYHQKDEYYKQTGKERRRNGRRRSDRQ
ncbi:MAG: GGDEF domain-containing protein [Lachnospiraceae bacterium]|nr:GGDEF domain-containing protein [Lachnospiraceae bacterium]